MKTCSHPGCYNPVWSKGACKKHAPRASLIKRTKTIAYQRRKGDAVYNEIQKRNNFFRGIWKERPHACEICGVYLGSEPLTYMFDHLLEKSKHPDLRREPDNILLVCLECHDNKSRGIICDKYREKINFVKTKFNVS